MKVFALLLVSIFSAVAFAAEPAPPRGTFRFLNKVLLLQTKKTELVNAISNSGKERLRLLGAQGWTCTQRPNSNYLCSIFSNRETLPEALIQSLRQQYAGVSLGFANESHITLTSQTDYLSEYDVSQNVTYGNSRLTSYSLTVIRDDPPKIQLSFGRMEKIYLNITNEKNLTAVETLSETVSGFQNPQTWIYQVAIYLQR